MLEQDRLLFGVGEFSPRMCGMRFMGSVCASFVTLAASELGRAAREAPKYCREWVTRVSKLGAQVVYSWGCFVGKADRVLHDAAHVNWGSWQ